MTRFVLLSFLSLAACVPVQQQPDPGGAPAGGEPSASAPAAGGGGDHAASCRGACTVFDQCGRQPFDACMAQCDATMEIERLERFAAMTCDELHAVMDGTVGQACMSTGRDDCSPMGPSFVCCGGNAATGTPGQCIDAAVCGAPRY